MIHTSHVIKTVPDQYRSALHQRIYETLNELDIPFERVDTDEAITMEDCIAINERLDVKTVKTLFLCNRQKTSFYLFVTAGDKPFVTKDFSRTLGISRVSFAPPQLLLEILQTKVGATTVLSTVVDSDNRVQVVIDREVLGDEYYGCTDGTTTGYMKIKTDDVLNKYLPFTHHQPIIIEL